MNSRILRYISFIFLIFALPQLYAYPLPKSCAKWPRWFQSNCSRLHQIWYEGDTELYITGYAWHNRYRYDSDRVKTYNENAWGGGLGKGLVDEKGNLHSLFAFAFLDSHKRWDPILGYSYLKALNINKDLTAGLGITAFFIQRPDINNGIPFPGALPWASLTFKRVTLSATYIPGHKDIGNVLFILGKYTFQD